MGVAFWCLVGLLASCSSAPVSDTFTVSVEDPKTAQRGDTVVIPCWINPTQSAEDLEVRWYVEDHFDNPIILFKDGSVDDQVQEPSFVGRASFGLRDSSSGGLKSGDVSLQLKNVTVTDVDQYTCYVSSLQARDQAKAQLRVTETGSFPVLSVTWTKGDRVNVSCDSEGWFPQPELRWAEDLDKENVMFVRDSSGLFRVHSWTLVSVPAEVTCSVALSNSPTSAGKIHLEKLPLSTQEGSESCVAGWILFGVLLALAAVCAALYFWKRRETKADDHNPESDALLPKEPRQSTELASASESYVNVKLEDGNPFLKIKGEIVRDYDGDFPDGESAVTCVTALKGAPGFTSGQHYWEVSLGTETVEAKRSWWIGVTNVSKIPAGLSIPSVCDGFWFLSLSVDVLCVHTDPPVYLPAYHRPKTVGVHFDYDQGKLAFYDVEGKTLIATLSVTATGEVFPLFNPGKKDTAPMRILHRAEINQCGDEASGAAEGREKATEQNNLPTELHNMK